MGQLVEWNVPPIQGRWRALEKGKTFDLLLSYYDRAKESVHKDWEFLPYKLLDKPRIEVFNREPLKAMATSEIESQWLNELGGSTASVSVEAFGFVVQTENGLVYSSHSGTYSKVHFVGTDYVALREEKSYSDLSGYMLLCRPDRNVAIRNEGQKIVAYERDLSVLDELGLKPSTLSVAALEKLTSIFVNREMFGLENLDQIKEKITAIPLVSTAGNGRT